MEVEGEVVLDERQFKGRQERLVFAYLVSRRGHAVPREELAEIIWPGDKPPSWETALSALVSGLRGFLARTSVSRDEVSLRRTYSGYEAVLSRDVWVDLEAVPSAIDEAEGALRAEDYRLGWGDANVAATIARRPFLPGDDGDWVESQRRALERFLLRALECLAEIWLMARQPRLAIEADREAVTLDPFRESSYLLLMRAHDASGNRPEAVKPINASSIAWPRSSALIHLQRRRPCI